MIFKTVADMIFKQQKYREFWTKINEFDLCIYSLSLKGASRCVVDRFDPTHF